MSKKSSNQKPIIHGECFIVNRQVPEQTEDKLVKKDSKEVYIIGHSESGHHHMAVSTKTFQVLEESEDYDLYIRLFAPGKIKHKKSHDIHETQTLQPGDYAVYHKTEYDPFADELKRVFD